MSFWRRFFGEQTELALVALIGCILMVLFAPIPPGLLDFLLPLYDAEGKAYLTIGIGCTGGRHRSVAIANALAAELRARGREVHVEHRDVERSR